MGGRERSYGKLDADFGLAPRAAQQRVDGNVQDLSLEIEQGHFEGRLGEGVADHGAIERIRQSAGVERVLADEKRGEKGGNGVEGALLAFPAPVHSGAHFAEAGEAAVSADSHYDEMRLQLRARGAGDRHFAADHLGNRINVNGYYLHERTPFD